jgi:NADH pyrophosphatase NudC (nudix superfamily)
MYVENLNALLSDDNERPVRIIGPDQLVIDDGTVLSIRHLISDEPKWCYCARCDATRSFAGSDPYCMECGWDSLTEKEEERPQCAA